MKLCSFEVPTPIGAKRRIGAVESETLIDLNTAYATWLASEDDPEPRDRAKNDIPTDMVEFLRRGQRALTAAEKAIEHHNSANEDGLDGARLTFDLDEVRLLSPVPRPNSIRDFMVFEEHLKNSLDGDIPDIWYEIPIYYKGNPNAVVHPGSSVKWPSYTEKLDYELELAAVIGKQGANIDASDASDYIAGYTLFNDFSARDIQMREMEGQLGPTKGKDFANGFGPYLITADELEIKNLEVRATVNDEIWSEGNIGEMHHTFGDIIEYVSNDETLYPGDILGSGTVGGGCGLELDKWLSVGDTITLEAEGIGSLSYDIIS